MKKKGFLLAEETLKIVIAVICIGFLIYLLFSLYFKSKESKDLELAKESLDYLIQEVNLQHTTVEIYNPKGWYILSWPHTASKWTIGIPPKITKTGVPNYCNNLGWDKCICICKEDFQDNCDNCLQSDVRVENNVIKIDKLPLILEIKIEDNLITGK